MDKPLTLSPIQTENGKNIKVQLGISESQIQKLIELTNLDPNIRKFTSDLDRFPNRERFNTWQKGRFIYTLSDKEENLLGITWIEIKKIPFEVQADSFNPSDYTVTLAVRTYEKARGKGYFNPFLKTVIEHYKSTEDYKNMNPNGIWVSIAENNILSQKAFEKFGFKRVDNNSIPSRVFMILLDNSELES